MTLIFVYNADSGPINGLKDALHKLIPPSTYGCNLCAITFGPFGMRSEWRRFLDRLAFPTEFLHRDELEECYGVKDVALPAVFAKQSDGTIEPWIDADAISQRTGLEGLMGLIEDRIANQDLHRTQ